MRFFGIEQRNGVVTIPGPVSIPQMDFTALDGLTEALALKLDASEYTAADVLAKIVTVDGAGSGLDADLLDGQSSAAFAAAVHTHTASNISDFTEAAQDAVGAALVDSSTIDLTYTDAAPSISASIIADSVSNSLLADMAANTIKGTVAGGDPADLSAAQVASIIATAIATALNIDEGVYTPTPVNVTNLDAVTVSQLSWLRVRNRVLVSGRFTADPTAAGPVEFGVPLPVASNIGAREDIGGVGSTQLVAGQVVEITGDAANDRASFRWLAVDTASRVHNFIFMYRVI